MNNEIKTLQDTIIAHIQKNSSEYVVVLEEIEQLIDSSVKQYNIVQEEIIQSIIDDQNEIIDPEQRVRDKLQKAQQKIHQELVKSLKKIEQRVETSVGL